MKKSVKTQSISSRGSTRTLPRETAKSKTTTMQLSAASTTASLLGTVYDAGGGAGRNDLSFQTLQDYQEKMFRRSLNPPPLVEADLNQSSRQTSVVDAAVKLTINVALEDSPSIEANFEVNFVRTAAQAAWGTLLYEISGRLGIDFIEVLLDRKDLSQVHSIVSLRPGGHYLARKRESSSILDTIYSGKTPVNVYWPLTKQIVSLKQDLKDHVTQYPAMDSMIVSAINRPLPSKRERDLVKNILKAEYADQVITNARESLRFVDVAQENMKSNNNSSVPPSASATAASTASSSQGGATSSNGGSRRTSPLLSSRHNSRSNISNTNSRPTSSSGHQSDGVSSTTIATEIAPENKPVDEPKVPWKENPMDTINVHRVALEALDRITLKGHWAAKEVANVSLEFIYSTIEKFIEEVDIVVMGLKLVCTLLNDLNSFKYLLFKVALDCMQFYAPPSPNHRPRPIPRSQQMLTNLVASSLAMLTTVTTDNNSKSDGDKVAGSTSLEKLDGPSNADHGIERAKNHDGGETSRERSRNQGTVMPNLNNILHAAMNRPPSASTTSKNAVTTTKVTSPDLQPIKNAQEASQPPEQSELRDLDKLPEILNPPNPYSKPRKQWGGNKGYIGKKFVDESTLEYQLSLLNAQEISTDPTSLRIAQVDDSADAVVSLSDLSNGGSDTLISSQSITKLLKQQKQEMKQQLAMKSHGSSSSDGALSSPKKLRGTEFRCFQGAMKRNVALIQSFCTLYRLISKSPKNREFAFTIGIQEEISHIALVCQSIPQVLEYVVWIINTMYIELIAAYDYDFDDDMMSLDAISMQLSRSGVFGKTRIAPIDHPPPPLTDQSAGSNRTLNRPPIPRQRQRTQTEDSVDVSEAGRTVQTQQTEEDSELANSQLASARTLEGSGDGLEGHEIDVISTITAPTIGTHESNIPSPRVNIEEGLMNPTVLAQKTKMEKDAEQNKRRRHQHQDDPNDGETYQTGDVPIEDKRQIGKRLVQRSEKPSFSIQKPNDCVIIAIAMISTHQEMNPKERNMAVRWLTVWDDGTTDYQKVMRYGMTLSGL